MSFDSLKDKIGKFRTQYIRDRGGAYRDTLEELVMEAGKQWYDSGDPHLKQKAEDALNRFRHLRREANEEKSARREASFQTELVERLINNCVLFVRVDAKEGMDEWCKSNTTGKWSNHSLFPSNYVSPHIFGKQVVYQFENERDATLFKLFWYEK